jgi:hypothetical protein
LYPVIAVSSEEHEKWMATVGKRFHYRLIAKGGFMAKIIEFYIPVAFKKKATKWIPAEQQGKVLEFAAPQKRSA